MNEHEFAQDHPRTEEGWVHFPEDADMRKDLFPPEVMGHPAKANLYMIESIVDFVSERDEFIMDPMGGTGSLLIAAAEMGRKVILIEIEEGYHQLQRKALEMMKSYNPGVDGLVTLIRGDCRQIMPLPCDHIIFSPPYAGILAMSSKPVKESTRDLAGPYKDTIQEYSAEPQNIGKLSKFFYNQAMEKVYQLCYESVRPGGTLTVILQDFMGIEYGERKRIYLSTWMQKACIQAGFQQEFWFKRSARGTGFKRLWASRGYEVVNDEDIVMFRKPWGG